MTCALNGHCVPTPEIAVKPGKAAGGFPAVQTAIEDETFTPIQDENAATLVNEQ